MLLPLSALHRLPRILLRILFPLQRRLRFSRKPRRRRYHHARDTELLLIIREKRVLSLPRTVGAYGLFLSQECRRQQEKEEEGKGKGGGRASSARRCASKEVPWNRSGFYFVRVCLPLGLRSRL